MSYYEYQLELELEEAILREEALIACDINYGDDLPLGEDHADI